MKAILLSTFVFNLLGIVFGNDIISAMSRDGYGRPDPNSLLNGFFPAWPIVLLGLAG